MKTKFFALFALLFVATHAHAARAWFAYWGTQYGARVNLSLPDDGGTHPFFVPLEDVSAQGWGQYAGATVFRGELPSGKYHLAFEILAASGNWEVSCAADVEVPPSGEVWGNDWFGVAPRVSYGAGLPAVGQPDSAPVGDAAGGGASDSWTPHVVALLIVSVALSSIRLARDFSS